MRGKMMRQMNLTNGAQRLGIATAILFAGAGILSAQTYDCQFPRAGGMVPQQVTVTVNGSQATVIDPIIQQVHGKAIPARVSNDTQKRLTVKWELRLNRPLFYTISILRPDLRANLDLNNPVMDFDIQFSNEYGPISQGSRGGCRQR